MKEEWHLVSDIRAHTLWKSGKDGLAEIKVGRKKLALIRWNAEWYCLDARCPHQGGPLCNGFVEKSGELVCPWHRFRFNLADGTSNSGGYFVNTYPVRLEGKALFILLPKKRFWIF